jgi:hypothetical protein
MNYENDYFDFNDVMYEAEKYTELKSDVPDYSYIEQLDNTKEYE